MKAMAFAESVCSDLDPEVEGVFDDVCLQLLSKLPRAEDGGIDFQEAAFQGATIVKDWMAASHPSIQDADPVACVTAFGSKFMTELMPQVPEILRGFKKNPKTRGTATVLSMLIGAAQGLDVPEKLVSYYAENKL